MIMCFICLQKIFKTNPNFMPLRDLCNHFLDMLRTSDRMINEALKHTVEFLTSLCKDGLYSCSSPTHQQSLAPRFVTKKCSCSPRWPQLRNHLTWLHLPCVVSTQRSRPKRLRWVSAPTTKTCSLLQIPTTLVICLHYTATLQRCGAAQNSST